MGARRRIQARRRARWSPPLVLLRLLMRLVRHLVRRLVGSVVLLRRLGMLYRCSAETSAKMVLSRERGGHVS